PESIHPPPILHVLSLCSWKLTYLVLLSVFTNFIAIHAAYDPIMSGSTTQPSLLLMMLLSPLCLATLLVIGNIERRPGPIADMQGKLEVLAALATEAPNDMVRNCIRDYDPKLTDAQIKKKIDRNDREDLLEVMKYLRVPDQQLYTKPQIVFNFVLRIQSLFPEECSTCKETYCTQLNDVQLLKCTICDISVHSKCLAQQLGIDEDLLKDLGPAEVMKRINPFNIRGFHYYCPACEKYHAPSEHTGKLKKFLPENLKTGDPAASTGNTQNDDPAASTGNTQNGDPSVSTGNTQNSDLSAINGSMQNGDPSSNTRRPASDPTVNRQVPNPDPSQNQAKPICPHYKRGTCRHGISGNSKGGCSKGHPKACHKLIQYGTRGPLGCSKGGNCEMFHPRMCSQSLQARECLTMDCKLRHVRGTKRTTSDPSSSGFQGYADNSNSQNYNSRYQSSTSNQRGGQRANNLQHRTNFQYGNANLSRTENQYRDENEYGNNNQFRNPPSDQFYSQQVTTQNPDFLGMMQTMRQERMAAMKNLIAESNAHLSEQIKQTQHHGTPQQQPYPNHQGPQGNHPPFNQTHLPWGQRHNQTPKNHRY
ncbi:MAG: hypothetical protein VX100_13260, partial [Pseudomonadota bacterium]|nr:hypothetical protein [Pseudomonadota bacterium]